MSAGAKLWVCVDPTAERKLWVPAKGDATGILQVYDATSFASLATLLARIGDPSAHTLTSLTAKWGNIARSLDLILGARWDGGGDLGTDIAALITNVGDPSAHILKSITAKMGDVARSLDLILGPRWDGGGDLGTDIAALIAEHVIIWGGVSYTTGIVDDIKTYVDTEGGVSLADKLTLVRAGYLDNLSAGAVALAATALSTATWTAARAAKLDNLTGTVTTGTFSLVNNVNEQDALVVAANTQMVDLELDMVNLTQANTVREYVQTDGANYRQISSRVFPADFDSLTKAVILSFTQKNSLYKVTLQASVLEGAARDVPWRKMVRPLS